MWKILQQKKPDDYVIATGKQLSIRQFVNMVSKKLSIKKLTGEAKVLMKEDMTLIQKKI